MEQVRSGAYEAVRAIVDQYSLHYLYGVVAEVCREYAIKAEGLSGHHPAFLAVGDSFRRQVEVLQTLREEIEHAI
jgi:hypothetical protein